jgi:hypothetical protein
MMSDMNDAILVAIITGFFGIVIALVQKSRKENVRDHGYVVERLDALRYDLSDIDADLGVIEAKIDGHIDDHAVGVFGKNGNDGKNKKKSKKDNAWKH